MKKQILFLSILFFHMGCCNAEEIPRKNIIIVTDIRDTSIAKSALQILLERISLKDSRVAVFSATTGFYQGFFQFKSRKCLLKEFVDNIRHRKCNTSEGCDLRSTITFARKYISSELQENHSPKYLIIVVDDDKLIDVESFLPNEKMIIARKNDLHNEKFFNSVPFLQEKLKNCIGKIYLDECGRVCKCINGILRECKRVREEFSSMSLEKRLKYINAYLIVSTSLKYRKRFTALAAYHVNAFYAGLHEDKSQFFPWHRKYLLEYENLLRTVDCSITIPYWNWAKHYNHAWSITPFYHMWSSHGGFGGNGNYDNGYCVTDGPFQEKSFEVPRLMKFKKTFRHFANVCCERFIRSGILCPRSKLFFQNRYWKEKYIECKRKMLSTSKTCLKRSFSWFPPSLQLVKKAVYNITVDKLDDFALLVMFHFHDRIHLNVGGHMRTEYSSAAPEFWLHHSFLDSIWDKFQQRGDNYKFANLTTNRNDFNLLTFRPVVKGDLFIDNENLAGCNIRVAYTDIFEGSDSSHQDNSEYEQSKSPNDKCYSCYRYQPKEESSFKLLKLLKEKPYLFGDDFTLDCW